MLERQRESVCKRQRESVCKRQRESVCKRQRESVCKRQRVAENRVSICRKNGCWGAINYLGIVMRNYFNGRERFTKIYLDYIDRIIFADAWRHLVMMTSRTFSIIWLLGTS